MTLGEVREKASGIFAGLLSRKRASQQTAAEAFDEMACLIADGADIPFERIEQTAQSAGRTIDDMQRSVDVIHKRRAIRERLQDTPALAAAQNEKLQRIEIAKSKLDSVTRELRAEIAQLEGEAAALQGLIDASRAAQAELRELRPQAMRLKEQSVIGDIQRLLRRIEEVKDQGRARMGMHVMPAADVAEQVGALEAQIAERQAELQRLSDEAITI
jgi:predicted  nucleic acid-binding Zn-ribbon protein